MQFTFINTILDVFPLSADNFSRITLLALAGFTFTHVAHIQYIYSDETGEGIRVTNQIVHEDLVVFDDHSPEREAELTEVIDELEEGYYDQYPDNILVEALYLHAVRMTDEGKLICGKLFFGIHEG